MPDATPEAGWGLRWRGAPIGPLPAAWAIPVSARGLASDNPRRTFGRLAPIIFIVTQFALTTLRNPPIWLPSARLALCLIFIGLANSWIDPGGTWPLSALAVPVIALAAANGGRGGPVVVVAGMVLLLAPLLIPNIDVIAPQSECAKVTAALSPPSRPQRWTEVRPALCVDARSAAPPRRDRGLLPSNTRGRRLQTWVTLPFQRNRPLPNLDSGGYEGHQEQKEKER